MATGVAELQSDGHGRWGVCIMQWGDGCRHQVLLVLAFFPQLMLQYAIGAIASYDTETRPTGGDLPAPFKDLVCYVPYAKHLRQRQ